MPVAAHWRDTDWDKITLGSTVLPGVWVIEGSVERKIDVKHVKGTDGSHTVDEGYQPGEFQLIGKLESKADWVLLQKALKDVHPRKKGASRSPLILVHPAAATLGIEAVYVIGIDVPKLEHGIVEQRIKVLEWIAKPTKTKITQKPIWWSPEQMQANAAASAGYERDKWLQTFLHPPRLAPRDGEVLGRIDPNEAPGWANTKSDIPLPPRKSVADMLSEEGRGGTPFVARPQVPSEPDYPGQL
jgi:hypothetical protein